MNDNKKLIKDLHNDPPLYEAELIKNNTGLVLGIAKRFFNRGYDPEDIIQIGTIGLLKAIRKFDPRYNVELSTYAVPLIIGEIKRFLRDDGMIKVSRINKTNAQKASKAREKLYERLFREPTIEEISKECGLKRDEIIEAFNASAPVASIYASENDHDKGYKNEKYSAVNDENKILTRIMIYEGMGVLDKREEKIIKLRYFAEKTQKEISEIIGVSQVQISRIEKKALEKMRELLKE